MGNMLSWLQRKTSFSKKFAKSGKPDLHRVPPSLKKSRIFETADFNILKQWANLSLGLIYPLK
jgi:hypothetical protein